MKYAASEIDAQWSTNQCNKRIYIFCLVMTGSVVHKYVTQFSIWLRVYRTWVTQLPVKSWSIHPSLSLCPIRISRHVIRRYLNWIISRNILRHAERFIKFDMNSSCDTEHQRHALNSLNYIFVLLCSYCGALQHWEPWKLATGTALSSCFWVYGTYCRSSSTVQCNIVQFNCDVCVKRTLETRFPFAMEYTVSWTHNLILCSIYLPPQCFV